jgi:hypothetical protein
MSNPLTVTAVGDNVVFTLRLGLDGNKEIVLTPDEASYLGWHLGDYRIAVVEECRKARERVEQAKWEKVK